MTDRPPFALDSKSKFVERLRKIRAQIEPFVAKPRQRIVQRRNDFETLRRQRAPARRFIKENRQPFVRVRLAAQLDPPGATFDERVDAFRKRPARDEPGFVGVFRRDRGRLDNAVEFRQRRRQRVIRAGRADRLRTVFRFRNGETNRR